MTGTRRQNITPAATRRLSQARRFVRGPVSSVGALWVLVLALAPGCAGPGAEFRHAECRPIAAEGQVRSYEFRSSIATSGMQGEQLVFHVGLVDSRSRPIRSAHGRYQDETGQVSARRTLMVLEPNKLFEPTMVDAVVSLPSAELGVREEDLPVFADFTVRRAGGELLARTRVRMPLGPSAGTVRQPDAVATAADEGGISPEPDGEPSPDREPAPSSRVRAPRPPSRRARAEAQSRIVRRSPPPADEPADDGWNRATAAPLPSETGAESEPPGPLTPPRGRRRTAPSPATREMPAPPVAPAALDPAQARQQLDRLHAQHAQLNPAWWWPIPSPQPSGPSLPAASSRAAEPRTAPPKSDRRSDDRAGLRYRKYVVRDGDTLRLIAARTLRDATRWREILALNRAEIDDPQKLTPGTTLLLPPE